MNETVAGEIVRAARALRGAARVLVVAHSGPDPDAYGSSCGLTLALQAAGQEACCLNQDGAVQGYLYLPGVPAVEQQVPPGSWDLIVFCDCAEKERAGDSLLQQLPGGSVVLNIDHHYANPGFGEINVVDEHASSASELVVEVLSAGGYSVKGEVATLLLAGIMADSGCFRYSSTSSKAMRRAADLMDAGADHEMISVGLFGSKPLAAVRLEAEALSNLILWENNQAVVAVVTEEMLIRWQVDRSMLENFVERLRDIEGVQVAMFVSWHEGLWKTSLRSKDSWCDVSAVAAHFGGGGHRQAAALRWKGKLEVLLDQLHSKVRSALAVER